MSEIVNYRDGMGQCWARIYLENGDPIWISVTKHSVMVKKSRVGFFGKKLLSERPTPYFFESLIRLTDSLKEINIPSDIQHPALRRLIHITLASKSTDDLSERLEYAMNLKMELENAYN